ncbi:MAG: MauE/DoxX family redox-associated membrane protein [Pseudomonadota bacterium]
MANRTDIVLHHNGFELVARWLLGAVFVYASIHKIAAPENFAKIIYGYYLFPDFSVNLIAILLPFAELFAGLALLFGIYPRSAVLAINGMLLAFIFALAVNLARGHQFDCGCFSFGDRGYTYSSIQLLVRDIILFVLGLQVLFFDRHRKWCVRQTGGLLKKYIPPPNRILT